MIMPFVFVVFIDHFPLSYEANKQTASNSGNTAGTRVGAAIDAVGDKINENTHAAKKEVHKQRAMH